MTLLPIHIVELLTISLIFLSAFRVFKHLSLETSTNTFHIAQTDQPVGNQPIKPETKASQPVSMLANPTLNKQIQSNTNTPLTQPKSKIEENNPEQAQTLLKNYIGDFF